LRPYKPVPARLRPNDRIIGHTGFLVFARKLVPDDAD
jgi:tRNA (adenine57-N1/adenine58-N1)-methyltransferase